MLWPSKVQKIYVICIEGHRIFLVLVHVRCPCMNVNVQGTAAKAVANDASIQKNCCEETSSKQCSS